MCVMSKRSLLVIGCVLLACLASIGACLIGGSLVVGWPLSEPNFNLSIFAGLLLGGLFSLVIVMGTYLVSNEVRVLICTIGLMTVPLLSGWIFWSWCVFVAGV